MKIARLPALFTPLVALAMVFSTHADTGFPHEHGMGLLTLKFEGTVGEMMFQAPGDSIYGLERLPKTDSERKAIPQAVEAFQKNVSQIVAIDPKFQCSFLPKNIEAMVRTEQEGHMDFRISYRINCLTAPVNGVVTVTVKKFFPKLQNLKLNADFNGRTLSTVISDVGTLKI